MNRVLTVLVCGGRDINHHEAFNMLESGCLVGISDRLNINAPKIGTIIHGGARGADTAAGHWGRGEGAKVICCPANWDKHKKAAGPIRNQMMLDVYQPDVVVAIPGGKGTADMKRRAHAALVPVVELR